MCGDIYRSIFDCTKKAIIDASLHRHQIDEILLVGGSSRLPKVKTLLRDLFKGKEPKSIGNADEAVVYGAAIQAAILSGSEDEKLSDILLLDVVSHSLGLETNGGIVETLIKRNTSIPTRQSLSYTTYFENQPGFSMRVYEGEGSTIQENNLVGWYDLTGIPPAPIGVPRINVTFDINADGILTVSAVAEYQNTKNNVLRQTHSSFERTWKNECNIHISNQVGRLTKDQIAEMKNDNEMMKKQDKVEEERVMSKNSLQSYCYQLKEKLNAAVEKCEETLIWVETSGAMSQKEIEDKQRELESLLKTLR